MDADKLEQYLQRFDDALYLMKRNIEADFSYKDCGLTPEQFILLRLLSHNKKMTVSEIATALHVKPSAISIMADRLLKNQWIHRQRDDQDRRVVYIFLSAQGQEIYNQTIDLRKTILHKYLSKLTEEEIEAFISVHEKLAKINAQERELSR